MENSDLQIMYEKIFQGNYYLFIKNINYEIANGLLFQKSNIELLGIFYSIIKINKNGKKNKEIINNKYVIEIIKYLQNENLSIEEKAVFKEFILFSKNNKNENFDEKINELIIEFPFLGMSRLYLARKYIEKELLDEAIKHIKIIITYFPNVEYSNFLYTDLLIQKKEYEKAFNIIKLTRNTVNKIFYLFYLYRFLSWKYKIINYLIKSFFFIILFFIFKFNFAVGVFIEILFFYFYYKMYVNYLLPIFIYIRKEFAKEFVLSIFIIWVIYSFIQFL
jgi:hypothetical protein